MWGNPRCHRAPPSSPTPTASPRPRPPSHAPAARYLPRIARFPRPPALGRPPIHRLGGQTPQACHPRRRPARRSGPAAPWPRSPAPVCGSGAARALPTVRSSSSSSSTGGGEDAGGPGISSTTRSPGAGSRVAAFSQSVLCAASATPTPAASGHTSLRPNVNLVPGLHPPLWPQNHHHPSRPSAPPPPLNSSNSSHPAERRAQAAALPPP